MDPKTGEITRFEPGTKVPEGFIKITPGSFFETTIDGKRLVFVIREVRKKDIVIRLRVPETEVLRNRPAHNED